MAKRNWLDKMLRRAQDAETPEEIEKIKEDYKDEIGGMEPDDDDNDEHHIHVHLEKPNGGGSGNGGGDVRSQDDEHEERMAALEALVTHLKSTVEELQAKMSGDDDEDEYDMEDVATGDRVTLRRRKRATDEGDLPTPEKNPEMMGKTDLPGTAAGDRRTRDSVSMETLWQETIAAAEVLQPGVRLPTFDASSAPTITAKRLCAFRRRVLDALTATDAGRAVVTPLVGDVALMKDMTCDGVKIAFLAAAQSVRSANNARTAGGGRSQTTDVERPKGPQTLSDLQKIHEDHWRARRV